MIGKMTGGPMLQLTAQKEVLKERVSYKVKKPKQWKQLGWKEESEKPNSTNKVTTFMQCFGLSKTMTMNSSLL